MFARDLWGPWFGRTALSRPVWSGHATFVVAEHDEPLPTGAGHYCCAPPSMREGPDVLIPVREKIPSATQRYEIGCQLTVCMPMLQNPCQKPKCDQTSIPGRSRTASGRFCRLNFSADLLDWFGKYCTHEHVHMPAVALRPFRPNGLDPNRVVTTSAQLNGFACQPPSMHVINSTKPLEYCALIFAFTLHLSLCFASRPRKIGGFCTADEDFPMECETQTVTRHQLASSTFKTLKCKTL